MSTSVSQRGASLIELVMFIVIVGIAAAGIMLAMNQADSADALPGMQAMSAADALLNEIESRDFVARAVHAPVTQENRAAYHVVADYDGYSSDGIYAFSDASAPVLTGYRVNVSVRPQRWNGIGEDSAALIEVTVTAPGGALATASGYRTAHR